MSPAKEELTTHIRLGSLRVSHESLFLLACVLLAFLIRFFFIPQEYVINGDGAYYTILGERFVSGNFSGGISAYWSPLYSVLTGFSSLLFADRDFSGRFVSLVAGSLLIVPAFFLIRDFFGRPSAYVGAILLIFHPFLIKSSGWVMTESVYTFVLTTCVLSGWHAVSKGDSRFFLVTGLLLGIAFLTKPEAIGYLLLILLLTPAAKFVFGHLSFARVGFNCLVLLLGFAFFFLPYVLYLHEKTGEWTFSQKITVNLPAADFEGGLLTLSGDGRMTLKDRLWGDDYETEYIPEKSVVEEAPASFSLGRLANDAKILGSKAATLLWHQLRNYFPAILPIPFAIFAVAGFFFLSWNRTRAAKEIYLFSFVMCTLLGYAASAVELRYLIPIIPLLIAWAARGIAEFCEWLARTVKSFFTTRRELSPVVLATCVLILLFGLSMPRSLLILKQEDIKNVPFEEKSAGLWMKENSNHEQTTVISSHITPAYYAHAKHLYLPDEELSTVVEYARQRRANYLVFSERRKSDAAAFLAEKNSSLGSLDLVYHDRQNAGYQILVYQLNH
ncbi:MAG: ArnT family glycosyltransferase [Pyrinomonadaceae bacterium]